MFRSMSRESFTTLKYRQNTQRSTKFNLLSDQLAYNKMVNEFTNLREVDFSFCDDFTDSNLDLLSPVRSKLRVLKLRGTGITDKGVSSFFEFDKHVKWVETACAAMRNSEKRSTLEPMPSSPIEVLDLSETKPWRVEITNLSLLSVMVSSSSTSFISCMTYFSHVSPQNSTLA